LGARYENQVFCRRNMTTHIIPTGSSPSNGRSRGRCCPPQGAKELPVVIIGLKVFKRLRAEEGYVALGSETRISERVRSNFGKRDE